ncbi:hypothetical protein H113_01832, partial [Trichophyton rubrum MR1459]
MSRIRLCFPPMDGEVNCMHSKLMLLFHANHLRIVIPSANLDPYDWGEKGGVMENVSKAKSISLYLLLLRSIGYRFVSPQLTGTFVNLLLFYDFKMLFLIDLPRKANETVNDTTPFRDELVYFLRASTLNEK